MPTGTAIVALSLALLDRRNQGVDGEVDLRQGLVSPNTHLEREGFFDDPGVLLPVARRSIEMADHAEIGEWVLLGKVFKRL